MIMRVVNNTRRKYNKERNRLSN